MKKDERKLIDKINESNIEIKKFDPSKFEFKEEVKETKKKSSIFGIKILIPIAISCVLILVTQTLGKFTTGGGFLQSNGVNPPIIKPNTGGEGEGPTEDIVDTLDKYFDKYEFKNDTSDGMHENAGLDRVESTLATIYNSAINGEEITSEQKLFINILEKEIANNTYEKESIDLSGYLNMSSKPTQSPSIVVSTYDYVMKTIKEKIDE